MMMALGMFVFSLSTLAYQELQRQTDWKHPGNSRVGRRDAYQFTGKGEDSITLSGWLAPELSGSLYALDALRLMADTGKAWILIQGSGRIVGTFVITSMTENKTHLAANGNPARLDFTIVLKRTDDNVPSLLSSLGDPGSIKNMLGLDGLRKTADEALRDIQSGLGSFTGSRQ
ncbi:MULTISPECIES: phage tail protein [unclassified Undibacterium]|uniref:phage tail protein n=1 Tax=unclassified Undibacterium TaxID=2630295 RepID=UPI002AC8F731|nr:MULTISPECIES: phage tail protein [unclassified Undibacterium]MEB0137982.1 phage tail protein [Undibacterium sp. CCC2.1]MEB0170685.1 phage tail protein [Undibacterium sp. CCC1.1]MEB0177026.1 phage tail protein [Undibacterium sp. CCC3.4]MEB0216315.1 phage tail protein [Undibacterium sp. 5I2]WPX42499.1 phage tail protein [Undibacterium sp. CCC3.4]